jgi:AcrR family transcriptional regulator
MSPKPDVSAERKEQIFQAAIVCFGRTGYHKTKMDDIAAEAGLSKGALYWYFPSKKELFLSLFQTMLAKLEQDWRTAIATAPMTASEKLLAILKMLRGELGEMASFFGVMMEAWAQTIHDPDVEEMLGEFYKPYIGIVQQIIAEGIANEEFTVQTPEAISVLLVSMFDGLTLALGLGLVQYDWDELFTAAGHLVLRGLGVRQVDDVSGLGD